jgi:hypothetical protein
MRPGDNERHKLPAEYNHVKNKKHRRRKNIPLGDSSSVSHRFVSNTSFPVVPTTLDKELTPDPNVALLMAPEQALLLLHDPPHTVSRIP